MYNFRYHLVTIVSIFAALAIGLLLGVAITGSELVRDTSNDMTASLMEQFDDLNAENKSLSEQLTLEQVLRAQLFTSWQGGRLEGRTIVVLSTDNEADNVLDRTLTNLITSSGGIPVLIDINQTVGFGTSDTELLAELNAILPSIDGEDYSLTIARALSDEWSYRFTTNGTSTSTAGAPVTPATGSATDAGNTPAVGGATDTDNTPAAASTSAVTDDVGSATSGDTANSEYPTLAAAETAFAANYPLTTRLVELGCLSIKVDYSSVLKALAELPQQSTPLAQTQRDAYQLAQDQQLPYACNGLIDTVDLSGTDSPVQAGRTALSLASFFNQKGIAEALPYLGLQADQDLILSHSTSQIASSNYYVVLVQTGNQADTLIAAAYEYDLSCVVSPFDPTGRYGIVALLSGAESGVYGLDRDGIAVQPSSPLDKRGTAAFLPPAS